MAANPYVLTLNYASRPGMDAPVVATYTYTPSDVANAFAANVEDGLLFVDLPKQYAALYLHPSSFATEDGEDTSQLQVFVNGQPTSLRLQLVALASAANTTGRVPNQGFRGGSRIGLKQLT